MSLIRPEAASALARWREPALAGAILALGAWIMAHGGWFLLLVGGAVALVGAALGLSAIRRIRFARTVSAPGVVEVDEGQIAYLGPQMGGFVSLRELVELRIISVNGRRHWRLKQADGQALLVPVDAAGAEALYDAYATLPGIDMGRILAALDAGTKAPDAGMPLWRRPSFAALT